MPPPRPPGLTRSDLIARSLAARPAPGAYCPSGKSPFASFAEARERVRWLSRRGKALRPGPGPVGVYRCQGCGSYHVGHRPAKRRRREGGAA